MKKVGTPPAKRDELTAKMSVLEPLFEAAKTPTKIPNTIVNICETPNSNNVFNKRIIISLATGVLVTKERPKLNVNILIKFLT